MPRSVALMAFAACPASPETPSVAGQTFPGNMPVPIVRRTDPLGCDHTATPSPGRAVGNVRGVPVMVTVLCAADDVPAGERHAGGGKDPGYRQLYVLRWIAARCPICDRPRESHKNSALALKSRDLARVRRNGKLWQAVLTGDGQHYLDRGRHSEPRTPERGSSPAWWHSRSTSSQRHADAAPCAPVSRDLLYEADIEGPGWDAHGTAATSPAQPVVRVRSRYGPRYPIEWRIRSTR